MKNQIHGVCQRMHDLAQSRPKEKFIPLSKKEINKLQKSLLKKMKESVQRYNEKDKL